MVPHSGPQAVVVGVDGSVSALWAARWAARHALRDGSGLRLVHAFQFPLELPSEIGAQESILRAQQEQGRQWLDQARVAAVEAAPGVPVEPVLGALPVTDALLRESEHASMIVLGTRGLNALTGMLVGCTSVAVAGQAACPVVMVRGAGPDLPPPEAGPVVVGVDGTEVSEAAVAFAFAEAAASGADLVAVHAWTESVYDITVAGGSAPVDLEVVRQQAAETLGERLAGWQEKYPDVRVHRQVVHDRPTHALRGFAQTARLVVVGRRGRGGFRSLVLGSTSQHLLHHAPCPVAVIRSGAAG